MADTQGGAMTLEKGLAAFLDAMLGKNRSSATLRAYRTDIQQFRDFVKLNRSSVHGILQLIACWRDLYGVNRLSQNLVHGDRPIPQRERPPALYGADCQRVGSGRPALYGA